MMLYLSFLKEELYDKNEESINTYIKISGINYKVVGVYETSQFEGKNNITFLLAHLN